MNLESDQSIIVESDSLSYELEGENLSYSDESIDPVIEIAELSNLDDIIINKLPLEAFETLETVTSTQFIVEYNTDTVESQINAQRAAASLSDTDPDTDSIIQFKAVAYQTLEDEVLSSVSGVDVINPYSHLPSNLIEVDSPEKLIELAKNPDVVQIYSDTIRMTLEATEATEATKDKPVLNSSLSDLSEENTVEDEADEERVLKPLLAESLPQINQPAAVANGYTGSGTTVAVFDTGADPNAPGLEGRIVFSEDFAPDDGSVDDDGHGTNVSAIVAGVAPDTGIAALDVFNGPYAYNSDLLEGMNWSIANQSDYNIVAINMSLGGGRLYSPITGNDSLRTSILEAKAAGISTIAASGNSYWSDSMGWPAGIDAAVSVGAVNNSDSVASFSNSASFLDLMAPGVQITAGGLTLSGTSMATPHVAGAVAILAAADPSDSPDEVINTLKSTGVSITDNRNGLSFPRIDLAAALGLDGTPPPPPPNDDNYEENDTRNSAFYPGYDWEQTSLSSIDGEGIVNDEDWYEIDVDPGEERLIVDLTSSDFEGDIDLALYDSNGNFLTNSTSGSNNESIDYTVAEAGTYYLKVYPYSGEGVTYDLWWEDTIPEIVSDDNYEENDTRNSAFYPGYDWEQTSLSSIDGEGIVNDEDWYEIDVDPGEERLIVDLTSSDSEGDIDLALYDSDGNFLTNSTSYSNNESIDYTVAEAGTYYLKVYPYSGEGVTYDLLWEDTAALSTDVDLSGAFFDIIQESLEPGDSFDVEFEVQNTEAGDAEGFYADFYLSSDPIFDNSNDSDDILLGYQSISSLAGNSTTDILSESLTLPDASDPFWYGGGTYYIGMISDALDEIVETDETNNASTGEFVDYESIEITIYSPDDNYEENDDLASAFYPGSDWEQTWLSDIDGEGIVNDEDWYEIDIDPGEERLFVDLTSSDSEGDIDLQLYDSGGNLLTGSYSYSNNESINYTVAEAGTYYLQVYPYSGEGVTYDLWWDDMSTDINTVDNDFDGDGKADIHWRNGNQNRIWLMDGTTRLVQSNIDSLDSSWTAVGNGDFNGDGKADLLYRNGNQLQLWKMNGTTVVNTYTISSLDGSWSIGGIGDTDGDGDDDIVFRNGNANRILNIQNFSDDGLVTLNNYNSAWSIVGMGDTDGDGDDDILFRKGSANRIWEIESNGRVSVNNIGNFNSRWTVAGLGDTDGDGDDDILWRKGNANRLWEIQDNGRVSVNNIGGFNSAWQVEDVEDYDGDGDDDILFRNGNKNRIWEMDNNGVMSKTNSNSLNAVWQLIG